MHGRTAPRLALALLAALSAAATGALPTEASDIARPFLEQSGPPVVVAKGVPTLLRATRAPGGIQLSLTQAYPIQGGALVQLTFQSRPPSAAGYAVTAWVEVTPPRAAPYRVAQLPGGKGVLQRSGDGGLHWRTTGPTQVRTTGSNVVFTLLQSDGATSAAVVRAGWTAAKPDGSGVQASAYPAVLGTLAGTGPWRLPAVGLAATKAARTTSGRAARAADLPTLRPPPLTCAAPPLAFSIDSTGLLLDGPGDWPQDASVTVGIVPDLAGAFAPAFLRGSPAEGRFEKFPAGFGGTSTGDLLQPSRPSGPFEVPMQELIVPPLSLRGDGAVTFIVRFGGGGCEQVSPVIPVRLAVAGGPGATPANGDPEPSAETCAEVKSAIARLTAELSADETELAVARASVQRLRTAVKLAKSGGYAAIAKAGFAVSTADLQGELDQATLRVSFLEKDIDSISSTLDIARKRMERCR